MATNSSPAGGEAWARLSLPQQTMLPSNRMPQVWSDPLLIAVKVSPSGGEALPYSSSPQHHAMPFAVRPQAWLEPLLTVTNGSSALGGFTRGSGSMKRSPSGGDD